MGRHFVTHSTGLLSNPVNRIFTLITLLLSGMFLWVNGITFQFYFILILLSKVTANLSCLFITMQFHWGYGFWELLL